ncbi:hypothetical protein GLU64_01615 [Nanohaloarchaea archaeon]|nr:hypothetical protein [Candidatus Nanohaloarchaea archaeon]
MIRLERTEYGTFLLFDLPFMDQEQGIGYSPISLEQEEKRNAEDSEPVEYESKSCNLELR